MLHQFYGDVLPEAGYYCLTLLPSGQHLWAESLDELVDLSEQNLGRQGLYFGTAAFQSFANRKQSNVLSLKALRLDIDAGPEKVAKHGEAAVYASQRDALAACVAFFQASRLVPSYIVSSGAGLHVYFCLDEALPPAAWRTLSEGLTAAGRRHGLKIDPAVTEDTARVLRVPGAPHPNGQLVRVLKATGHTYTLQALERALGTAAPRVAYDASINDELDTAYQGPPSSALKIVRHCGALREVAESRGDVPEPYWRAMIGLVKRTTEGLDIAQEWSSGYDGYDERQVERKFHAWQAGPTTCKEFARYSSACASCPHSGKVKSPIALGVMTAVEIERLPEPQQATIAEPAAPAPTGEPWDGFIPAGFSVETTKGGSRVLVQAKLVERESATGETVPAMEHIPFTHSIFWFGHWSEADHSDDTAQVTLYLWAGTYAKKYTMDQSVIASQNKLLEFLSGKSIHVTEHKKAPNAMQAYARAQLRHIHSDRRNLKVTDHLGLRTLDSGELVAVHGRHTIFPDGSVRDTILAAPLRQLSEAFQVPVPSDGRDSWGPEVWDEHIVPLARRHVQFLEKYYGGEGMERFQLAIMLGLASPLMTFVTGEYAGGGSLPINSSLSVSLYSRETARGKTSAAQSAILAFGRPSVLSSDSGKAGASVNGRLGRLSLHGTMPNIMDEMSDLSPAEVATTVSSVANGTGKQTMTQTRVLRQESTWALINLITTNVAQRDMVAAARSVAGPVLYRLLEIDVDGMPEYPAEMRAAWRDDWRELNRECAGALGAVIHREVCALGLEQVLRLVSRCVTRAEELLGAGQSARFQSRGLGAMLALDVLLRRRGLAPFALPPLVKAFKAAHDVNVEYVVENTMPADPLQLLARALLDMAPNTVVTATEPTGRGYCRPVRALNARMPDKIVARHVQDSGLTYVDVNALKAWCSENRVSERLVVGEARAREVLVPRAVREPQGLVLRSANAKVLTVGLEGAIALRTRAYTFNVRLLNQMLGLSGTGFELIVGGAEAPQPPEDDAGVAPSPEEAPAAAANE